jgi:hypothetical protein
VGFAGLGGNETCTRRVLGHLLHPLPPRSARGPHTSLCAKVHPLLRVVAPRSNTPRGRPPHSVRHPLRCYLGVEPHFDLWWRIFRLSLNKDGSGSAQWIGAATIQLRNNLKSRYLELSFPNSEKGWHRKWFYLSNPSGSFSANSVDRLGAMAPPSWKSILEGPALEVVKGLLNRVTTLKDARVTG